MYVFVDWVEQIFQRNAGFSFDMQSREPYSQVEFTKQFSHFFPLFFLFFFKSHAHCFEKHSNVMLGATFLLHFNQILSKTFTISRTKFALQLWSWQKNPTKNKFRNESI